MLTVIMSSMVNSLNFSVECAVVGQRRVGFFQEFMKAKPASRLVAKFIKVSCAGALRKVSTSWSNLIKVGVWYDPHTKVCCAAALRKVSTGWSSLSKPASRLVAKFIKVSCAGALRKVSTSWSNLIKVGVWYDPHTKVCCAAALRSTGWSSLSKSSEGGGQVYQAIRMLDGGYWTRGKGIHVYVAILQGSVVRNLIMVNTRTIKKCIFRFTNCYR